MNAAAEALWSRALRALDARGLLPANRHRLTPGELAAEVARRGEDGLVRLVNGWYYPSSYGHVEGVLSDDEALGLVVRIEAGIVPAEVAPAPFVLTVVEEVPVRRRASDCQLCGLPVTRVART